MFSIWLVTRFRNPAPYGTRSGVFDCHPSREPVLPTWVVQYCTDASLVLRQHRSRIRALGGKQETITAALIAALGIPALNCGSHTSDAFDTIELMDRAIQLLRNAFTHEKPSRRL